MKKLLLFIFPFSLLAAVPPQGEVKAGNFRFCSPHLRKVYGKGVLDAQVSMSGPLWEWLRLYGSANYISCDGRTRPGHHNTTLRVVAGSLGLQGMVDVAHDVKYYLTLGPRYFHIKETRHSVRSTGGGFANTGFLITFRENIFIDFFAEYSRSVSKQVGGLTIGGGLGCQF